MFPAPACAEGMSVPAFVASSHYCKRLKVVRDANVHQMPVALSKSVNIRVPDVICLHDEEIMIEKYENGELVETPYTEDVAASAVHVEPQQPEVEHRYEISQWPGVDVLVLAQCYLDELKNFIDQGIAGGHISG